MGMINKHILRATEISLRDMLVDINDFANEIITSLHRGETKYLMNASVKSYEAYSNPLSQQGLKGVTMWNILYPTEQISFPAKVNIVKLNLLTEDSCLPIGEEFPDIYTKIIQYVFRDDTGMFVKVDKNGKTTVRGFEVLAIPPNESIPAWAIPHIDYNTTVNNIMAPFLPVLEALGMKTLDEGKNKNGVNRKTKRTSNIVKI